MKGISDWFNVHSWITLTLVLGSFYLAIAHFEYREQFADLAKIGLGGYLGQMLPKRAD